MDPFSPLLSDHEIEQAKKRVWNRLEARLADRGVSPFQSVVNTLREDPMESNRLQQVMMKERLLDQLPDRNRVSLFMNRRLWATMTLSVFVAFFTVPVFSLNAGVQASAVNLLEVVQGDVLVNGVPVEDVALLQEGDEVMTGIGSMAHLQLIDDTRLTLAPRTEILLESTGNVHIALDQGRVWTQVVNPVSDSEVTLSFPDGQVTTSQRSSFDVHIGDEKSVIQVSENLVALHTEGDVEYEGSLGKGSQLTIGEEVLVEELPKQEMDDVWWEFNESYGKTYVAQLDEQYNEATLASVSILPDHPLYFLKSWRETVQENITFTEGAKQVLVAQHMELRLNEAQILIEQGKTEEAEEALVAYQEAVGKSIELSGQDAVEEQVEEAQKELLAKLEVDAGTQLLEDQLEETSALVAETVSEKNEVRMLSASQKLDRVPGLIEVGDLEQALYYLEAYREESMSILMELENVSLEEREVLVSSLFEQKMKDLQMLRVIASMPEFSELLDVDAQITQELSVMVLSLRERALSRLTDFFTNTDYDVDMQYELYAKLKDDTVLTPELTEQFEAVETALEEASQDEVIADIDVVEEVQEPAVDPRFLTPDND